MNETLEIKVRLLGAKEDNFKDNKYYTLSVRLADQTVGEMTGKGDFDFTPFIDKDVSLALELTRKNGRFGIRGVSAKPVKVSA